jgi:hypothetical protein
VRTVYQPRGRVTGAVACAALVITCLAGCGPVTPGQANLVAPAKLERVGGSLSVVVTPLGRQRIGIQTTVAVAAGTMTEIPFAALLYEPDGKTAVYTQTTPLIFTRQFITVSKIVGDNVLVSAGLAKGAQVVTVGAEELLGVQNGVGVET